MRCLRSGEKLVDDPNPGTEFESTVIHLPVVRIQLHSWESGLLMCAFNCGTIEIDVQGMPLPPVSPPTQSLPVGPNYVRMAFCRRHVL
jgi:hypothetical protein